MKGLRKLQNSNLMNISNLSAKHEKNVDLFLRINQCTSYEIPKDGDCFIRAVSYQTSETISIMELRNLGCVDILQHQNIYRPILPGSKKKIKKLRRPVEWSAMLVDTPPLAIEN